MTQNPEIPKVRHLVLCKPYTFTQRAVLKQINKLKEQGRLKHVGPDKGGHWETIIN